MVVQKARKQGSVIVRENVIVLAARLYHIPCSCAKYRTMTFSLTITDPCFLAYCTTIAFKSYIPPTFSLRRFFIYLLHHYTIRTVRQPFKKNQARTVMYSNVFTSIDWSSNYNPTHAVCVCTLHQNTKLMFIGSKIATLSDGVFLHYRHCLSAIRCNPPSINCYLSKCKQCPGVAVLNQKLQDIMEEKMVDNIEYKQ